jgi:predicted enzyme related to lactoylglutathione lyase
VTAPALHWSTAVTEGIKTIIHPVHDLAHAKALYGELLGVRPYMDESYYVGFSVGGQDIGLDPNGHSKGMTGPTGYWHVEDIRTALGTLLEAGATEKQKVTDVGGGKLIASVTDKDGNVIGLLQAA